MVSIRLGQQRREEATSILGNTLILNFLIGGLLTILGLIFLDDLLILFGASPKTLPYARDFMQIILIANVLNHNFLGLNSLKVNQIISVRGTGTADGVSAKTIQVAN